MKSAPPWLDSVIERTCERLNQGSHPIIEEDILELLEQEVQVAYPLLDLLLQSAKSTHEGITSKQQACLLLLCELFAYVHFAIEQQRPWAIKFSQQVQHYIARNAFVPEVDWQILQSLLDILHQTEIEVIDAIRDANIALIESSTSDEPCTANNDIAFLLADIEQASSGCEFEIADTVITQTHPFMPIEVQMILVHEMMQSKHAAVRRASILMLMHPEPLIREQTASMLLRQPEYISSTCLRRMIVMRNWLPLAERPNVDKLVRLARLKNIDCASWPTATITQVVASEFDGMGSQSMLLQSKQGRKYRLSGILLKEGQGIKEPILFQAKRKNCQDKILREMAQESCAIPVSQDYLDTAMQHFIFITLAQGNPPSPLLLRTAELAGKANWRAEELDQECMINELLTNIDWPLLDAEQIDRILNQSQSWLSEQEFARSWIEQDAEVDDKISGLCDPLSEADGPVSNGVIDDICDEVLEPRRKKWSNRLLWMAMWAKGGQKQQGPKWHDFLILAKAIADGVPLQDIPLMRAICKETINYSAYQRQYVPELKSDDF